MDYNEFAEKIKTKYPDYADMDNRELAQKMVAKFPDYKDVTFDGPSSQPSNAGLYDLGQKVQSGVNSVMGPVARAGDYAARGFSNLAFGSEKPVEYAQKGIAGIAKGVQKGEEYVSGKLGEMGVNPYVAGAVPIAVEIAAQMLIPSPKIPGGRLLENAANTAERSASSRWFKGLGGTLSQAKELGAEETLRLGRSARNKGVITAFNGVEDQAANIATGLETSGKRIGELRNLGDLYGQSPESAKIVQTIQQDLGDKYKTGIRSGEVGELQKAVDEVLKLEPIDKLTPSEEMAGFLKNEPLPETNKYTINRSEINTPTIEEVNPNYPMSGGKTRVVPNPDYAPSDTRIAERTVGPYDKFRAIQEDPSYIPEYDLRRPTTYGEVAKVATDLNAYAKGQSKLLQPSGATTDVANVVSRVNDESLLNALPKEKGQEYLSNLQDYGDYSKMDRINEIKNAYEVGGSRNSIVNNIANRIYQKFGHQLSAGALDRIASVLRSRVPDFVKKATAAVSRRALITQFVENRIHEDNQ